MVFTRQWPFFHALDVISEGLRMHNPTTWTSIFEDLVSRRCMASWPCTLEHVIFIAASTAVCPASGVTSISEDLPRCMADWPFIYEFTRFAFLSASNHNPVT